MKPRADRNLILHSLVLVPALLGFAWLLHLSVTGSSGGKPGSEAGPTPVAERTLVRTAVGEMAATGEPRPSEYDGIAGGAVSAAARASASGPPSVAPRRSVAAYGGESASPAALDRAGLIAAIDPETGMLGPPSPEQARAIASVTRLAVSHSPEGLIEIHRPDGAVGIDLQGRFRDYAVVWMGSDGIPAFGCLHVDGPQAPALGDTLSGPPALEDR